MAIAPMLIMGNFGPTPDTEAVVDEIIYPNRRGRVRFQGSFWPAKCLHPVIIYPGEVVQVRGTSNITLIVEPNNYPKTDSEQ